MKYSIIRSMFVAASALLLVDQGCAMGAHQLSEDDRARQAVGRETQLETQNIQGNGTYSKGGQLRVPIQINPRPNCRIVDIYDKAGGHSTDIAKVTYDGTDARPRAAIALPGLPNGGRGYATQYSFVDENSIEAAVEFHQQGIETAILNFADPHKVGGGFLNGRSAQEEDLCRCTTLYASLTTVNGAKRCYYDNNENINRNNGTGYVSERVMVSPVLILRTDAGSNRGLKRYTWLDAPLTAHVISAAAVDRSREGNNRNDERANGAMVRLIRNIVKAAIHHHCETLVLGAFGCGVFKNDAGDVAGYFRQILVDEGLGRYFRNIVFPIKGGVRGTFSQHFRDAGANIVRFD